MTRLACLLTLTIPLTLIACGDKGDGDDTASAGPVDQDGDGFSVDDDCNDNDAAIYPGAEDTWYDDVDSDCAGDDDFDADADGVRSSDYGGGDCDDADATIYPGAAETWYDGVDSDCAGDNDNDADVDGFDGVDGGGNDCDDQEPTTYPGAPDTWYDGVDSDCVGDSDYDADHDSYDSEDYSGEDCDDTDANINPAAEEVWYDGVDGNCDDADDYDADMDGQQSDEHGGSDCDDFDDTVMYGIAEKIDGKDTDCDGTADLYTTDEYDTFGGSNFLGTEEGGEFGWPLVVGDFDFDGVDDIMVGETGTWTGHLFTGATLTAGSGTTASADFTIGSSNSELSDFAAFENLDGAGTNFVAMGAWEDTDAVLLAPVAPRGAVYLFSQAELAAATDVSDASWVIWGSNADYLGTEVVNAGDLTGDGTDELVASAIYSALYVFDGAGLAAASGTWGTDDAAAEWTDSGTFVGDGPVSRTLAALGDLDGDGYGELAVGEPYGKGGYGRVLIVEGGVTMTSGDMDDLAWVTIDGESTNQAVGKSVSVGDIDGDSVMDVIIGASGQDSLGGRAHVVLGADITAGSHNLSDVSYVSYTGATVFGKAGTSVSSGYDVNGDGLDDIAVGGPGDSAGGDDAGEAYLIISGSSGNRALADAAARFTGGTTFDEVGLIVGLGDFDGNGLGDIVFAIPGEDDTLGDEGAFTMGLSGY